MMSKKRKNRFTVEEDSFIRENYLNMTDEEIGNILNRSGKGINTHRVNHLKLTKRNVKRNSKYTTPYNLVKKNIEKLGYKLISEKYKNNREKLTICDNDGYYYSSSYEVITRNGNISKFHISNPFTIQNIKLWCQINKTPFTVISEEYNGNTKDLKWQCVEFKDEIFSCSWDYISKGMGCSVCSGKQIGPSSCKNSQEERTYTDKEDRFIKENYLNMTDEEMGRALGRSANAVKIYRAKRLKVYREKGGAPAPNRLSYEYVKDFIENESGSGCKLISKEYVSRVDSIIITCSVCNTHFKTSFAQFKNTKKYTCNKCSVNLKDNGNFSYDYVKKSVEKEGYILLSNNYINANEKLDIQDAEGYRYSLTFSRIKAKSESRESTFSKFYKNNKFTIYNIQLFLSMNNRKIKLLSTEYRGSHTPLTWECGKRHVFSTLFNNIKKGHGCPYCAGQGKPSDDFIRQEFEGRGYDLFPFTYMNNSTKLQYICRKHKEKGVQEIDWAHFRNGSGCYYCGRERMEEAITKTTDMFVAQVYDLTDGEYEVLGEYVKADVPIKMRHNLCGYEFMMPPKNFVAGNRCTYCNSSVGVCKILNYLIGNNYSFDTEFMFDDCVNPKTNYKLPFDIVVYDDNESLRLIEYDGEQHFYPVNFNGISDEKALISHKRTVRNDKIKNTYCKNNNIELLRIPYWERDNTKQILDEFFNKN